MTEQPTDKPGRLATFDAWMSANPWHPRITPFAVYILFLALLGLDGLFERLADITHAAAPVSELFTTLAAGWKHPATYAVVYTTQCTLVVLLMWRYRRLTPELNVRFHWLALPTAVLLTVAWVLLGFGYNLVFSGEARPPADPQMFERMRDQSPTFMHVSLGLRLLGMSLVVPLFEEMFVRSAALRGMHSARQTGIGIVQVLCDLPMIGDWLMHTKLGQRALDQPGMFTRQLERTPLGDVSLFAVFASTLVFLVSHMPRDWMGCVACGVVWCWLVWWTNRSSLPAERRLGLGPVVWSHGLTNALLWGYTVVSGDWQFL